MADAPDHVIWGDVLAHLRATVPTMCRQWFDDIEPMGISNGVLWLRAPTEMQQRYLRSECAAPFREAAQAATQRLLAVNFLRPGETPTTVDRHRSNGHAGKPRPSANDGPLEHDVVIDPDNVFETFIVGPTNRFAYAASRAVGDSPATVYNPLFIHGGVGLGKTHLLHAICHRHIERTPDARIAFMPCERFVSLYTEAIQSGKINEFRHRFREASMLVLDDVHFLCKRDASQEEFFHTFNTLYQSNRQIVLSSDAAPDEIPDLELRLVSRFNWGLVVQLEMPEYETRIQIVLQKARERRLAITEEVAGLIAARFDSNIRDLEGALYKVSHFSKVEGIPLTVESAGKALGVNTAPAKAQTSIQTIIDRVSEFYEVPISMLLSRKRTRSIALPRHVGMHLARKLTRHSLEEIGGYFGGRDHTTVMYAVRTIEDQCSLDAGLNAQVREIERGLME